MKYLNNLYWASVTIMTVGYGDIVPRNTDELIVACFVMLFGICLFTYNLSSLAQQFAEIIKTNNMRGEVSLLINYYHSNFSNTNGPLSICITFQIWMRDSF